MQLNLIAATLFVLTTISLKAEKLDSLGTPIINEFTQTICRGDIFEGYMFVGTYRDTFTTGTCDSIRILHLRFFTPTLETRELICIDEEEPNPPPFGTTTETRIDSNGCEFILEITVAPVPSDFTANLMLCEGQSTVIGRDDNRLVTIDGDSTIIIEYRTAVGCTSTGTYIFTVIESEPSTTLDISICEGDSIFWDGGFVFEPGTYEEAPDICGKFNTLNLSFRPQSGCLTSTTALPNSTPLLLYPNPSSDFITVEGLGSSREEHRVRLLDLTGQSVYSTETSASSLKLDLVTYDPGLYLMEISSARDRSKRQVVKFIKQ